MADPPTLDPGRVRAVVTTKWSGTGYKPVVVRSIESYFIESNLDQDSDNFSVVIGDPTNALSALRNRDSEIRIQLFGVGADIPYLLTGIVDDVDVDEQGSVTLTGRDNSALATDTMARAGLWRNQKANQFIEREATRLKMTTRFNLLGGLTKKTIRSDGSETAWELWYRLLRKDQQWLWFTSDGWLTSNKLKTGGTPDYYFGTPPLSFSTMDSKQWIPVEKVAYKKSVQSRVYEVIVLYKSGGHLLAAPPAHDKTMAEWLRKPLKFIEDRHVSTEKQATKTAYEEIYEGKVGALEIKVTIPDIGIIIRQNRLARLHIPEMDLGGDWFVVGSRIIADDAGYTQEIRLREEGYSISKRVPDDPEVTKEPGSPEAVADCVGLCEVIPRWCDFFVNAMHNYRGGVDPALFLSTLLALCEHESNFRNERNNGGPVYKGIEWFKWDGTPKNGINSYEDWKQAFANNPGRLTNGVNYAVGPFQLLTMGFKVEADHYNPDTKDFTGDGPEDEYSGFRWLPEANIMEGAKALNGKAGSAGLREETLWYAVANYYGSKNPKANQEYSDAIRNRVYRYWLKKVRDAMQACQDTGGPLSGEGIHIPQSHDTDHCTAKYESFYAYDFTGNLGEAVFLDEGAKPDPSYGQDPHLIEWKTGFGGWTFQVIGPSKTQYWFTHLDENDPNRYQGGPIPPGGYVGHLTSSDVKAKLTNPVHSPQMAHVHVGSPQWPKPPSGSRGCPF